MKTMTLTERKARLKEQRRVYTELELMKRCYEALEPLKQEARVRVLTAATILLGLRNP